MTDIDFDTLLRRLDQIRADPRADPRHTAAKRDTSCALRALNDASAHVMGALGYPARAYDVREP
jgi:hypothetical protein